MVSLYAWLKFLWAKTAQDPPTFWGMVTAVGTALIAMGTLVLAYAAWKQLGDLAKTNKATFILQLRAAFFTADTRRLFFLVDEGLLAFVESPIPHFEVDVSDDSLSQRLEELGIARKTISTYEIDDLILGPLEDVGMLERDGIITLRQAYDWFYSYIDVCAGNPALRSYIKYLHSGGPSESDIYEAFDRLHRRLRALNASLTREKSGG